MSATAAFASLPASVQRRYSPGISITARPAAIARRASAAEGAPSVRRWERTSSDSADEDDDDVVSTSETAAPKRFSKTLAGGDDDSLTFVDHRRMCRAVTRCKTPDEVLALASASMPSWNNITLAASFVAIAKGAARSSPASVKALLASDTYARMEHRAATSAVHSLGARGVVNILHSVATLHQNRDVNPSTDLISALDKAVERTSMHMRPKEVAAAMWSYVALDASPLAPTLSSSLTLAAARVMSHTETEVDHQGFELGAGAREVASLAASLAKLGVTLGVTSRRHHKGTTSRGAGSSSNGSRVPSFGSCDVGDTTWEMLIIVAAAAAAERDATAALHPAVKRSARDMNGQGVMNALWAYAEMAPGGFEPATRGSPDGDAIHAAADAIYDRLFTLASSDDADAMNSAEAAGSLAACAKIKTRGLVPDAPPETLRALCARANALAGAMSAKEAANCAWARSRLSSSNDDANLETECPMDGLDAAVVRTSRVMNGWDVSTALWAYDGLREGELRRLDGGKEKWLPEDAQEGVARFPRSVSVRGDMFRAMDAALARTLPAMNSSEKAQVPRCWHHRIEELREELGLRNVENSVDEAYE